MLLETAIIKFTFSLTPTASPSYSGYRLTQKNALSWVKKVPYTCFRDFNEMSNDYKISFFLSFIEFLS